MQRKCFFTCKQFRFLEYICGTRWWHTAFLVVLKMTSVKWTAYDTPVSMWCGSAGGEQVPPAKLGRYFWHIAVQLRVQAEQNNEKRYYFPRQNIREIWSVNYCYLRKYWRNSFFFVFFLFCFWTPQGLSYSKWNVKASLYFFSLRPTSGTGWRHF